MLNLKTPQSTREKNITTSSRRSMLLVVGVSFQEMQETKDMN